MPCDVIVIGAGAAGLAAAGELGRHGCRVLVLEARNRTGGRILSVQPRGWPVAAELGAEFIHGGSDTLRRIFRRARVGRRRVRVPMWWHERGGLREVPDFWPRIGRVADLIPARDRGWSFAKFMTECGERVSPLDRRLTAQYIAGFNAAPLSAISAVSLRADRAGVILEDFKPTAAYHALIAALQKSWPDGQVRLRLRAEVRSVRWKQGAVEVRTRQRRTYRAAAAVVTLPLGVLQADVVKFAPPLKSKLRLVGRLGWGHVVRTVLRFRPGFWNAAILPKELRGRGGRKFGFINAPDQPMPTWWALSPPAPVITAWAGGDAARRAGRGGSRALRARALRSLANVLGTTAAELARWLVDFQHHDWTHDPCTRGAYSFTRAGTEDGAEQLAESVRSTLFFAGEATAEEPGTVHGAVDSGLRAAHEVRKALKHSSRRPPQSAA